MLSKCCTKAIWFIGVIGFPAAICSAARLGHPGVSTRGATSAQTQWNILCDPAFAQDGTISTQYSANTATLTQVQGQGPYTVSKLIVQVLSGPQGNQKIQYDTFVPMNPGDPITPKFLVSESETGYAQVVWSLPAGQQTPTDPNDDITHLLTFTNTNSADANAIGTFTDYMDPGTANGGQMQAADFYDLKIPNANPPGGYSTLTYSGDPQSPNYPDPSVYNYPHTPNLSPQFDLDTVSEVVGTPEPASLALFAVLMGLPLLRRRRK